MRKFTLTDRLLDQADQAARTLFARPQSTRQSPAGDIEGGALTDAEREHAGGLMRINHTGEVCAQALYFGQSMFARDARIRSHLLRAASEEGDHLAWCQQRLDELDQRASLLNPLWYLGSFALGAAAAMLGDQVSLGFVAETERQVESHLNDHMQRLPDSDNRSRAIVSQMASDEAEHGRQALDAGGEDLPDGVRQAMGIAAGFMKLITYRV